MKSSSSPPHQTYRPEIDGLRAIAVLAVLIYHAFPETLPGGFSGVDIFFVISGYLISGILFTEFEEKRFRFSRFYKRRIKRIFPALLVVLLATVVVGWFTLFNQEFVSLGREIAHAGFFLSNFLYWNQVGYFDKAALSKPLLHLWSLAIEEQFYLLWPVAIGLTLRLGARLNRLTESVLLASFLINLIYIDSNSAGAYYSPLSRFWELMVGAYLALVMRHRTQGNSSFRAMLGLVLIGLGFVWIDEHRAFPGWWALLPTLGTALVISAGSEVGINRRVLGTRTLVGVGLISYPLYLWHWPLLSFSFLLEGGEPSWQLRGTSLLLSVVLAWLTYRWVEQPIRTSSKEGRWVAALSAGMILVTLLGLVILHTRLLPSHVFDQRTDGELRFGFAGDDQGNLIPGCSVKDPSLERLFDTCLKDKRGSATIALVGDSKADALRAGLVRNSTAETRVLVISNRKVPGALVPVLSDAPLHRPSQEVVRAALDVILSNENLKIVVIAASTRSLFRLKENFTIEDLPESPHQPAVLAGLREFVGVLARGGKKVILVIDNPTLPDPVSCSARVTGLSALDKVFRTKQKTHCSIPYERQLSLSQKYRDVLSQVAGEYPQHVRLFDATDLLCDRMQGFCTTSREGRGLYSYSDHISDYASDLLAVPIVQMATEWMKAPIGTATSPRR